MMVAYDIEYHRDPFGVGSFHELFAAVFRTVIFINGEAEIRIVSPADVPFELHNRHQFDGIYTQVLQVIQGIDQG